MMKKITIAVAAALLFLAFHYAMMKDAENLCSNDATAYEGCYDKEN